MQFLIGDFGHLSVILAFVSALVASFAYYSAETAGVLAGKSWQKIARTAFGIHAASVFSVFTTLFYIIYTHDYRYNYAWSHSSNHLPVEFMISCFWEGQEGSFLLWIVWHVLIGLWIVKRATEWENSMMAIFCAVQAFLTSMILGVMIGESLKIGSSPFITLKDARPDFPVFLIRPDYVPEDGKGLNPLLQNYWMVIHPPTLFLGFALTIVPFCYAIAGLWRNELTSWVKPAITWVLSGSAVLGLGIMMGAYWAYETLNFGGYWNWDPVENAVYIPWLIMVASLHTLITFRRSGYMLKASYILVCSSFLLILYATFLTRSGILGNASVHSFTDLGLSGQLLIYLLFFVLITIVLIARRWKQIPEQKKELTVFQAEFWIFLGVLALCLASFQVVSFTSIPVYNALAKSFGVDLGMAPPADQLATYSAWQLWFSMAVAVLSVVGQMFWYKKVKTETWWAAFLWPVLIAFFVSGLIILLMKVDNLVYMAMLLASVFAMVMSLFLFFFVLKQRTLLSAGTVAHSGLALLLIGLLFSSGYSKVLSINNSGMIFRKEFTTEMNRDNILLWRGSATQMGDMSLTYKGNCWKVLGFPTYVKKEFLAPTEDVYLMTCRAPLEYKEKVYFKKGDTVTIEPENTFYAIEYERKGKEADSAKFILFPRAQVNPSMGLLASPDVHKTAMGDIYSHVSSIPGADDEKEWKAGEKLNVSVGDTMIVNDFIAQLVQVVRIDEIDNVKLVGEDLAVKAIIRVLGSEQNYIAEPVFVIQNAQIGKVPFTIPELGLRFTIENIDPVEKKFTISTETSQKDWVILKVMEKPLINLVWLGTLVICGGFWMAWFRRIKQ